ncbi:hypothetical protein ACWGNM_03245 [Streptomyces sp. NPDC055796]
MNHIAHSAPPPSTRPCGPYGTGHRAEGPEQQATDGLRPTGPSSLGPDLIDLIDLVDLVLEVLVEGGMQVTFA